MSERLIPGEDVDAHFAELVQERDEVVAARDAAIARAESAEARCARMREALEDATDVLAIFRLFQSATAGMKARWPVVQYGNQSLSKAVFDDALETHEECQRALATDSGSAMLDVVRAAKAWHKAWPHATGSEADKNLQAAVERLEGPDATAIRAPEIR